MAALNSFEGFRDAEHGPCVNPHILELVKREHSHAVVTRIVHTSQAIFPYERMQAVISNEMFGYYLHASVDFCVTLTSTYLPLVAFEVDSEYHDQGVTVREKTAHLSCNIILTQDLGYELLHWPLAEKWTQSCAVLCLTSIGGVLVIKNSALTGSCLNDIPAPWR